jgi:hypothetical protein
VPKHKPHLTRSRKPAREAARLSRDLYRLTFVL